MKKLTFLLITLALTACVTPGNTNNNTANTDKTNPNDRTYRGGSL